MAEDFMPCPFCGGAPRVMHCGAGTYMVQCVMCKATTDDGSLDRISANWNRRSPETDEDRTYGVLATIAPPDNGTTPEVLSAVLACANAWVPEARIIGNVRAGDIARVLTPIVATVKHDECCGRPIHDGDPEGYVLACCGHPISEPSGCGE